MKNEIRFTLESKQRPKLAQEIGNILGTAPHYERVPSCAYDIAANTQFISRLCDTARDVKRVPSKPTDTDNDKYAFRCFLLRLGFIGKEYKTARKILLRNLTGNSAFRCGE